MLWRKLIEVVKAASHAKVLGYSQCMHPRQTKTCTSKGALVVPEYMEHNKGQPKLCNQMLGKEATTK
eukprot:1869036-Amphidinium_carterae.1